MGAICRSCSARIIYLLGQLIVCMYCRLSCRQKTSVKELSTYRTVMLPVNCPQCLQSLHLTAATVFKFLSARIPITVGHVSKTTHPYCTKSMYKIFICNRGGVGSYVSDPRFRPQQIYIPSRTLLYC